MIGGDLDTDVSATFGSSALDFLRQFHVRHGILYRHHLTNMSAILFLASLLIFLIGIIAEQISAFHYQSVDRSEIRSGLTKEDF